MLFNAPGEDQRGVGIFLAITRRDHGPQMQATLSGLVQKYVSADLATASGRAIIEERYWSLRKQVPIVYLLGLINLSAMEIATTGRLSVGFNLPTFIAGCGLLRMAHWFGSGKRVTHELMVRRMQQTIWFAALVCLAVCARSLQLLGSGDTASHMAVMLFGGLTAIGVAYGLTALPAAGRIPLILIIVPISGAALWSREPRFAGAAFGLVAVAMLTLRLQAAHSRHFTDVIKSRSVIAREQERVELAHQEAVVAATTDFLTSLPNRRAFVAALEAAATEHPSEESFAVAILDLDRFKAVNDTYGHGVGDRFLQEVAARLVEAVGGGGVVARLGGDEFGILIPQVESPADAASIGRNIRARVNGAVYLEGRQLFISACCGIALSRSGVDRAPSRLMADADLALYQAKEKLTSGVAVFEYQMEAPRRRRTDIENALLAPAVFENLHLVFQPIFNLRTGAVIAHEALARWNHPKLGAVSPAEFVPIAEHLNLITHINNHLMAMAFKEARNWPVKVKLSFNLSAIQLCSAGSARVILSALDKSHLAAKQLQVEVTETALLADFERARENLNILKGEGATIVLDDFGAGYASIGYLRELRFDQIKLDGGLVTAAKHSADGKRLLKAVIGLCEILGVSTIAEHVESEDLLKLVVELGCSGGQGFWLKRPIPARELELLHGRGNITPFRRPRAA
jgi:diguanylate cyclase (GGDEF)-like protein